MFKTLTTLIRATAAEAEEALFDANAVRLLEQRLREAASAFEVAKRELALVMAEETREARAVGILSGRICELEAEAQIAIEKTQEPTAIELAERIAGLEDERTGHEEARRRCGASARRLRASLDETQRLIGELRRGLSVARSSAAVERSRERLSKAHIFSQDAIREAHATLIRVEARQTERADFADALDEVEREIGGRGYDPDQPRRRPRTSAASVLERLKSKSAPATSGSETK